MSDNIRLGKIYMNLKSEAAGYIALVFCALCIIGYAVHSIDGLNSTIQMVFFVATTAALSIIFSFLRNNGVLKAKAGRILVFLPAVPALYLFSLYIIEVLDQQAYFRVVESGAGLVSTFKFIVPAMSKIESASHIVDDFRKDEVLFHYSIASLWSIFSFFLVAAVMTSISEEEKTGIIKNSSINSFDSRVAPLIIFRYLFVIVACWFGFFFDGGTQQCTIRCWSIFRSDLPIFLTTFSAGYILALFVGMDYKFKKCKDIVNGK